jgi:hypothetical protein
MCGIHNFYLDKRKTNKLDEHIDIILDYPIEVRDDEYLKVKLCDFKFLNNIYNISSTLMNNQFNIRRYSKTYTYQFGSGFYFDDTGFFNDQNALIVDEVVQSNFNVSKIAYNDLTLTYYNVNTITDDTASYWKNILNNTTDSATRKMRIEKDNSYFQLKIDNDDILTKLKLSVFKDTYVGASLNVDFKLQYYNTNTTAWVDLTTNTFTFVSGAQNPTEELTNTLTIPSPQYYNEYRLICDTASLPFDLYITKLQGEKQIPIFDSGTVNTPVENTITIPDGFYKASNLKTTLNDLLTTYKITTTIDPITNKIKFSNDNTTFTPTIEDLIDDNFQLDLVIPNIQNMKENLGITDSYQQYIPIPFNSYYESDTHINLINLSKIIITTNLNFQYKTHNEFITGNDIHRGFGNILTWINADEAPLTCIKYRNYEDLSYKIENKHITSIRLMFYNEKGQPLILDNALIHLQIKKLQKKSLY